MHSRNAIAADCRQRWEAEMPVHKTKGGYKYGTVGKVYPTKKQANKQATAIRLSQIRAGKRPK